MPAIGTLTFDPVLPADEGHGPARLVTVAEDKKEICEVDLLLIVELADDEAEVVWWQKSVIEQG
jgi:urocanate hydratase